MWHYMKRGKKLFLNILVSVEFHKGNEPFMSLMKVTLFLLGRLEVNCE